MLCNRHFYLQKIEVTTLKLAKHLCCIIILCHLAMLCSCVYSIQIFPSEGVWHCNELDIQISFDAREDSFITINGNRIVCTAENDRGSTQVIIICQDFNCEQYTMGETIMVLTHVELTDDYWVMQDNAGREYLFEKQ